MGNRLTIRDGNNHNTTFVYNELNQLVEEEDPLGIRNFYFYDTVGNLIKTQDNYDIPTYYWYDSANRLTLINYPDPDPDVDFEYDAAGNRVEMIDGVGTTTWTYDQLNRVTAVNDPFGDTVGYDYDGVGNRLTQETHEGLNTYVYDDANRLIEVDGVPFVWDDNGNLIRDDVRIYGYDHANRLSLVLMGGDTYNFEYNGLGDRLKQIVNGETTNYTLDINRGLTQVLMDGTNAYLYGFQRIGELQIGGWQYHLGDALRSVRQLVNVINNGVGAWI